MNSNSLKLLFVIKSLGTPGGGAERVLCDICSALAGRGHSVTIASFDDPRSSDFYSVDQGVERLRLGIGKAAAPSGPIEFIRRTARLQSLLATCRPQVSIGFMHSAFVPLAIAGRMTGVPVIASEHISFGHYRARPLQRALACVVTPLCAAITAPMEDVRSGFPPAIAARMKVISNPVTVASSRRSPSKGRRRLLFVGNFRAQKDHRTLIAAFARLASAYPEWDLRLVGDGELRGEIEAQVLQLGVESRVLFAGAVNDMAAEYSAADLYVVPSTYESFGLATAEALSSGMAAVGFADCAGTNRLIEHGRNGILVEGNDRVAVLAEGLARLMASAKVRNALGKSGPGAVNHYSLHAVADRWEELLRSTAFETGQ